MLSGILDFLRIRKSFEKMQMNAVAGLIFLWLSGNANLFAFAVFLAYETALITYGYLLNSFEDEKQDRKAGKDFGLGGNKAAAAPFLIILPAFAVALSIAFREAFLFGALGFFLATAYSLRPVRLKERGIYGVVSSSLAQSSMPFLFLSALAGHSVLSAYFAAWLFLRQMAIETEHHISDFENDKKTGVKSIAVLIGKERAGGIMLMSIYLFIALSLAPILLGMQGIALSLSLLFFSAPALSHILRI